MYNLLEIVFGLRCYLLPFSSSHSKIYVFLCCTDTTYSHYSQKFVCSFRKRLNMAQETHFTLLKLMYKVVLLLFVCLNLHEGLKAKSYISVITKNRGLLVGSRCCFGILRKITHFLIVFLKSPKFYNKRR